jgi:hypothetical protein
MKKKKENDDDDDAHPFLPMFDEGTHKNKNITKPSLHFLPFDSREKERERERERDAPSPLLDLQQGHYFIKRYTTHERVSSA